jgi:hypothetical protein
MLPNSLGSRHRCLTQTADVVCHPKCLPDLLTLSLADMAAIPMEADTMGLTPFVDLSDHAR